MNIKLLIKRLPIILLGYLAACLAAGAILIPANLWASRLTGDLASMVWFSLYGFSIYVGVLVLPVLAVVAITEILCIRRLLPYLLLGALCLIVFAFCLLGPTGLARNISVPAIIAGAGIAAGLVYWSIAGHNAGVRDATMK